LTGAGKTRTVTDKWREFDAEDTIRFYALRLHEIGMIKRLPAPESALDLAVSGCYAIGCAAHPTPPAPPAELLPAVVDCAPPADAKRFCSDICRVQTWRRQPSRVYRQEISVIRLTQLDGKLPNLALMKLAAYHRDRGDEIVFTRSPYRDPF
jgi:hypothetical protein